MVNATTAAFRKMMLNGRMNQLMTEAVEEGIDATKAAYGIDGLEKIDFKAATDAEPGQLREDADTYGKLIRELGIKAE